MTASFDRRLTPAREDLAAEALKKSVSAERYVKPVQHRLRRDRIGLHPRPDAKAPLDSVLLYGEDFDVFEIKAGWAWGQAVLDGYVGYVPAAALHQASGTDTPSPTHAVKTLGAHVYTAPELKQPPRTALPFAARVHVRSVRDRYAQIGDDAWIPLPCLRPLEEPEPDWVAVAEGFRGVPYVWGGRSSYGIDCSGLVQLSLQSAGLKCLRDSDMQEADLGGSLGPKSKLRRGDLIFWKGHVGLMTSPTLLLHANAHHMAVTEEPLAEAIARIKAHGDGEPTRRARLDGDAGKG